MSPTSTRTVQQVALDSLPPAIGENRQPKEVLSKANGIGKSTAQEVKKGTQIARG